MLKIVKKDGLTKKDNIKIRIIAVIVSILASALIVAFMGYNPIDVFSDIVSGSIGTEYRRIQTIQKTIPLLVMALGISVAFKMKFWNIGAEGQFYVGAMTATFIALNFGAMPKYILLLLMIVASFLMAGIYCVIPAILKSKFDTSETLVTLMMNYIAIGYVTYLQYGPWKDPNAMGQPKIATFTENAVLPKVFGIHIGWIIALVIVIFVHLLITKSKVGYEIEVLGENVKTASYAGMNTLKIVLIGAIISGGICGIAGMIQASGVEKSLTSVLSGGLGFTAIIVAWLAGLSAPIIVVVSFLFSMLLQGGVFLQTSMQISATLSEVLQGIILFFVLSSEFFVNYKIVKGGK